MTFEEVDVDAVADLGPEDVEAREVFGESKVEGVNNPFLDFLLSGGDASGLSVGGRRRNARIQSGETSRSDGEILDIIMQNVNVFIFQTQWSLTAAYTARILMRSKVRVWRAENSGLTQSFLLMKGKKKSEQETIQHINCPLSRSLFFSERQYGIEWRRPGELVAEPSLMEGGGDRFDINQVTEKCHDMEIIY